MGPSRFTRLKVIAGYMLMLMLLSYALYYIYEEVQTLHVLEEKQILNSESLNRLIRQKDVQMMDLFGLLRDSTDGESVPAGMISEILKTPVISTPSIPRPVAPTPIIRQVVIEEKDSIVQPQPKKGFFRRLAEVFVPSKDSVKHVVTSVTVSSDSIMEVPVTEVFEEIPPPVPDNFSEIVVNRIQTQLKRKNDFYRDTIAAHQERIRLREMELTAQIDSILKAYEKEVVHRARVFNEQQKAQRNESIRAIAAIAVSAICLVAIFVFIIGRDITRSNRYRRELEIAKNRAEDLLRVREQLMLTITHDFKAPLSSVIGYTDLLAPLLKDELQHSYLNNIQNSSQHLLKLVSELLDFHRLDMQKEKVNAIPFVPYDLFQEVATAFLPVAHEKGLELETEFSEELRTPRKGDVVRIRQLIDNLTSNALKFTEKGRITLSADIVNNRLVIRVKDTGKGIDQADREKIFRAFTRLANAQGQEGFGLGLSIVQKIVNLLGGTIDVQGKKGVGTTFTIRILLPKAKQDVVPKPLLSVSKKDVPADPVSLKGLRIILIDDDKLQLQLSQNMLEKEGVIAVGCLHVHELIDRLRKEEYDYLITDVQMPALNGFDLLKLLRSSQLPIAKNIPVIAATAQSNVSSADFTTHGFLGYLHKPVSLKELSKLIHGEKGAATVPSSPEPKTAIKKERVVRPGSPGLSADFESLTAFCDGSDDSKNEIYRSFLQETGINIAALERALHENNTPEIGRIAHKQLTLFTMIKAEECIPMLLFLEKADPSVFSLRVKNITKKLIKCEHSLMNELRDNYL